MATKKVKKRVSNGISSFQGNKEAKESQKIAAPKASVKTAEPTPAPLVITVTRHHYPALKSMLGSHAFMTADGRELRNLLDLGYALEEMAEDTFRHHASDAHNHFSNWLKDCFELDHLAQSIKGLTKEQAHAKVLRHMLHEMLK
jgi:hypothetical protein